jgi:hypothetical protein
VRESIRASTPRGGVTSTVSAICSSLNLMYTAPRPGSTLKVIIVSPSTLPRHGDRALAFFSMTAVVSAPLDVTVAEAAIESFYPADAETTEALHAIRG